MKYKTQEQVRELTEKPLLQYEKKLDAIHSKSLSDVIDAGYGRYTTSDMRKIENKSPLVIEHLAIVEACYQVAIEKRRRIEFHGSYRRIKFD